MKGMSLAERIAAKVAPVPFSGCWIYTGTTDRKGYGVIRVGRAADGRIFTHRAAYMLAKGPIPEGMLVCHTCDTPSCVNPDHLFIGTNQDNTSDMMAKGRNAHGSLRGETNPNGKLTADCVRKIRLMKAAGEQQKRIAELFGISPAQVCAIVNRKFWKHVA